jgi:hypothetical protein
MWWVRFGRRIGQPVWPRGLEVLRLNGLRSYVSRPSRPVFWIFRGDRGTAGRNMMQDFCDWIDEACRCRSRMHASAPRRRTALGRMP